MKVKIIQKVLTPRNLQDLQPMPQLVRSMHAGVFSSLG